jgi:hypothetical protein
MRLRLFVLVLLFVATSVATRADAAHWDFIYTDRIDVTLCTNGCGITLAGTGYALLVNKGTTDISASQLFGATYTVESSEPSIRLWPFVNNPGPPVAPIHPNEAVGSVGPYANNGVLLPLIQPGETFRNTWDWQVFAFGISREYGAYSGPVRFDVTMNLGGESATFTIVADVHVGDHAINFVSAARTSSNGPPTAAVATTWGQLKARYR